MILTIPKSTTYKFKFKIKDKSGQIIKKPFEDVLFTVQEDFRKKQHLLQKTLKNNTITFDGEYYHIIINPKDTYNLYFNSYVFDLKAKNNEEIIPLLMNGILIISESTYMELL